MSYSSKQTAAAVARTGRAREASGGLWISLQYFDDLHGSGFPVSPCEERRLPESSGVVQ